MNEIINVQSLSKSYQKVKVLDNLSFTIQKGELFAILGPNGSGKSTLISMILGLVKAESGQVLFASKNIQDEKTSVKSAIGVVFQNSILDQELSVKDNLVIRSYFYTKNWQKAQELAQEKLADVQGSHLWKKRYGVLSGGEKRKVDIARALLNQPQVLFLDEPTTGLDIISRAEMWELVNVLKAKYQMTILLTTHYMEEARDAGTILMLQAGKILAYDTPANLKSQQNSLTLEDVFIKLVKEGGN
ncbi:ABC transporter ATP-binding protein [Vagococcus salmoninarum]|uniref:ABC transporter ATP-binding protein n=1 Tax=Vagococcus salmoninarum TaxID=2739 RepID=UPI003F96B655